MIILSVTRMLLEVLMQTFLNAAIAPLTQVPTNHMTRDMIHHMTRHMTVHCGTSIIPGPGFVTIQTDELQFHLFKTQHPDCQVSP